MDMETAEGIIDQIDTTELVDLKKDLVESAGRYARLRALWYIADTQGRTALDAERTRAHDVFIDSCNILSRNMMKQGEDNSWRRILGDNRGEIGDFACFLLCILGLRAR